MKKILASTSLVLVLGACSQHGTSGHPDRATVAVTRADAGQPAPSLATILNRVVGPLDCLKPWETITERPGAASAAGCSTPVGYSIVTVYADQSAEDAALSYYSSEQLSNLTAVVGLVVIDCHTQAQADLVRSAL